MGLAEIRSDAKLNRQQLLNADLSKMDRAALAQFVKTELAENVWPFLEGLAEATQKEMGALEEAVEELDEAVEELEAGGESLSPETSQQIMGVLGLGHAITAEIVPFLGKLDDARRKKLKQMIRAYREATEVVGQIVVAITVKPEAAEAGADALDEDEDGEDDDAEPGNDSADADGTEDDGLDDPEEG